MNTRKKIRVSDEEIEKWAERHCIQLGKLDLRQAFEDAASLEITLITKKKVK